jgi:hypothetical protein
VTRSTTRMRSMAGPTKFSMAKAICTFLLPRSFVLSAQADAETPCIPVPGPRPYAIAAHHDLNSNDKRDGSGGLAFSGNPRLSLMRPKPSYAETAFVVDTKPKPVDLRMLYRYGLSIRAVTPRAR